MFYGEVDTGRGTLRYSNAGHNYPLIRRQDGTLEELGVGGIMLGPLEDARYEQAEVGFAPGDGLLLYSDGISEAFDGRGGQFGEDRLQETWRSSEGLPPRRVLDRLIGAVERFRGSEAQSDDITALVVGPHSA